ncbi:MAG: zinc ribbon domain-containing protein [Eubacteriaceae bacterium]
MPENNSPNKPNAGVGTFTIGFILFFMSFIFLMQASDARKSAESYCVLALLSFVIGIILITSGTSSNRRQLNEIYTNLILNEHIDEIEELAKKTSSTKKIVMNHIQYMIKQNILKNAYLDKEQEKIIIRNTNQPHENELNKFKPKLCSHCGAPIDIGSKICQYCGSSI